MGLRIPGRGEVSSLDQLHAELALRDPLHFAWWLSNGTRSKPAHLQYISSRLARAAESPCGRVIIAAPPRHGKSSLISESLTAWYVNRWPERQVIETAYGAGFAQTWGEKVRDLLVANQERLRVRIRGGKDASAGDWNTTAGGGMLCAGVGGPILGRGAHLLIIDDPTKNAAEAYSVAYQEGLKDWYQSTARTRMEPGGCIVVTMQRWPGNDFVQWLLDGADEGREQWELICLPAVAEDGDPLGRLPGAALWPERYDAAALEQIRLGLEDQAFWDSQWQQNPKKSAVKGLAYHAFSAVEHPTGNLRAVEYDPRLQLCLACDFNVDPMAWLIAQIEKPQPPGYLHPWQGGAPPTPRWKKVHILDEIYLQNSTTQEACAEFIRRTEQWASRREKLEVAIYGDASGHSRKTTAPADYRVMEEIFRQDGRYITAAFALKNDPPVRDRVTVVNNAFCNAAGERYLTIHPRCKELRKDLGWMRWKRDLAGNPTSELDKSNPQRSHISDALGYLVWREMGMRPKVGERGEYIA